MMSSRVLGALGAVALVAMSTVARADQKSMDCPDGSTITACYDDGDNVLTVCVDGEPNSTTGDGSTASLSGKNSSGNKWGVKVVDGFWGDEIKIYCVGGRTNKPTLCSSSAVSAFVGTGGELALDLAVTERPDFLLSVVSAMTSTTYEIREALTGVPLGVYAPTSFVQSPMSPDPSDPELSIVELTLTFAPVPGADPGEPLDAWMNIEAAGIAASTDEPYKIAIFGSAVGSE